MADDAIAAHGREPIVWRTSLPPDQVRSVLFVIVAVIFQQIRVQQNLLVQRDGKRCRVGLWIIDSDFNLETTIVHATELLRDSGHVGYRAALRSSHPSRKPFVSTTN